MFFTPADMIRLYANVRSAIWCYKMYRIIKSAYELDKPGQILTVRQFCDYMTLDIHEVYRRLGHTEMPQSGSIPLPILRQAA